LNCLGVTSIGCALYFGSDCDATMYSSLLFLNNASTSVENC